MRCEQPFPRVTSPNLPKLQTEIMNSSCKHDNFNVLRTKKKKKKKEKKIATLRSVTEPNLAEHDGGGCFAKAEASYRHRSAQVVEPGETTAGCHN